MSNAEWNYWYARYLRSSQWKKKAQKVRQRDHFKCKLCGKPGYIVHHKTYERVGHEWMRDLITVCEACHKSIHQK